MLPLWMVNLSRRAGIGCSVAVLLGSALGFAESAKVNGRFTATAYSTTGVTASGEYTHRHVVAADPDVIPIGSRIRIRHAGKYSGEYVVADTGEKIVGRRLDLYIPNTAECKRFGRKSVQVKVIELGEGTHASAKQASATVKKEVAQDVAKGVVGHAATETDWAVHTAAQPAPAHAAQTAGTPQPTQPASSTGSAQPAPPRPSGPQQ